MAGIYLAPPETAIVLCVDERSCNHPNGSRALFGFGVTAPHTASQKTVGPFVEAFVLLIAVPLALAWATQWADTRWHTAEVVRIRVLEMMVPLMAVTLWVVVASQLPAVASQISVLGRLVPIYLVFALIMMGLGWATARVTGLDVPGRKAVALSEATRNSLVVLPAALATGNELIALAVVTQTLVELLVLTGTVTRLRRIPTS